MKRGPKPKRNISEKWSSDLAYAVGLIVTDGCLARDSYLIDLTSKDKEQLENFQKCLGITKKIGQKNNGSGTFISRVQFKNYFFYKFLMKIGLRPAKSKTVGGIRVPNKYFFHFLRGVLDGDGCTYSYWDKRWKSSFMFYTTFVSASDKFITWLRERIKKELCLKGHVTKDRKKGTLQLKYAKSESLKLLKRIYKNSGSMFLSRKRLKVSKMLSIVGEQL